MTVPFSLGGALLRVEYLRRTIVRRGTCPGIEVSLVARIKVRESTRYRAFSASERIDLLVSPFAIRRNLILN